MQTTTMTDYQAQHFLWATSDGVATITLNRPERKNPLTFESYAELRDLFRSLTYADDVHAVVIQGAGGNFCSGGDVHEIIGPLTTMNMVDLLAFTRMTGDLVKAMRACRQPISVRLRGFVQAPVLLLPWPAISATQAPIPKSLFCSTRWGWRGVIWAPARYYPDSLVKAGPVSCCISVAQ